MRWVGKGQRRACSWGSLPRSCSASSRRRFGRQQGPCHRSRVLQELADQWLLPVWRALPVQRRTQVTLGGFCVSLVGDGRKVTIDTAAARCTPSRLLYHKASPCAHFATLCLRNVKAELVRDVRNNADLAVVPSSKLCDGVCMQWAYIALCHTNGVMAVVSMRKVAVRTSVYLCTLLVSE